MKNNKTIGQRQASLRLLSRHPVEAGLGERPAAEGRAGKAAPLPAPGRLTAPPAGGLAPGAGPGDAPLPPPGRHGGPRAAARHRPRADRGGGQRAAATPFPRAPPLASSRRSGGEVPSPLRASRAEEHTHTPPAPRPHTADSESPAKVHWPRRWPAPPPPPNPGERGRRSGPGPGGEGRPRCSRGGRPTYQPDSESAALVLSAMAPPAAALPTELGAGQAAGPPGAAGEPRRSEGRRDAGPARSPAPRGARPGQRSAGGGREGGKEGREERRRRRQGRIKPATSGTLLPVGKRPAPWRRRAGLRALPARPPAACLTQPSEGPAALE